MTRTAFLAALLMTCGSLLAQPANASGQDDSPFDKGTWTLSLTGGYITPIRYSEDKFVNLNLGAGYYFHDNHQANLELEGYYSDEREEVPYDEFGPGDDNDVIIGGLGSIHLNPGKPARHALQVPVHDLGAHPGGIEHGGKGRR